MDIYFNKKEEEKKEENKEEKEKEKESKILLIDFTKLCSMICILT